jgi:Putative transposase
MAGVVAKLGNARGARNQPIVISNLAATIATARRLFCSPSCVTFKYKDYRVEGPGRYKTMTLATNEFIRRFLMHVLPKGFHRIRHYGLFANSSRVENIARARELLGAAALNSKTDGATPDNAEPSNAQEDKCPCCGGRMIVIETFDRGSRPRYQPSSPIIIRVDTS